MRIMERSIALSLLALAAATALGSPARAFDAPSGCTPRLSIQARSCLLVNIWTCEGDAPGEKWMALFNANGPARIRKVDAEFQWLETYLLNPLRIERMRLPASDPESLTELFETGYDTYDFVIETEGEAPERIVGYDRLTGGETVIDGQVLLDTEYAYEVQTLDGEVLDRRQGAQYVVEDERIFTFGTSWDPANPDDVSDATPMQFLRKGDPGFFPDAPIYDCGTLMSYPAPEAQQDGGLDG